MSKPKFYFQKWGLTPKDFKKWGKQGGRPKKYVSVVERQKVYRRKKAQKKIDNGEVKGILNLTTGRINKLRIEKKRPRISSLTSKLSVKNSGFGNLAKFKLA